MDLKCENIENTKPTNLPIGIDARAFSGVDFQRIMIDYDSGLQEDNERFGSV